MTRREFERFRQRLMWFLGRDSCVYDTSPALYPVVIWFKVRMDDVQEWRWFLFNDESVGYQICRVGRAPGALSMVSEMEPGELARWAVRRWMSQYMNMPGEPGPSSLEEEFFNRPLHH